MKTIIFHILRTFRFIIVNGAKILSGLFTLGAVIAPFSDNAPETSMIIAWAVLAVLFGASAWYYDALLRKLEPTKSRNQEWS